MITPRAATQLYGVTGTGQALTMRDRRENQGLNNKG
jgi:hypothetical protein